MSEFAEGLAVGMNTNGNCNYGGNGMGWGGWGDGWWILLLLLCGWGNNGWGGNNQNAGYELGRVATTNDVASGFSTSTIMSNPRDLQLGQANGFAGVQQTLCQGFSGINQTVMQGFHGVDNAICNLGYRNQQGFNDLSRQIGDCCCDTRAAIADVKYANERQTCDLQNAICNSTRDIIDNQRAGTDRIIGFLTNQEMDRLRTENQTLRFEKSQANQNAFFTANQDAQTAELLRRLGRDCPTPAYIVPNPNCCYDNGFGFNRNGNCGCGCGC